MKCKKALEVHFELIFTQMACFLVFSAGLAPEVVAQGTSPSGNTASSTTSSSGSSNAPQANSAGYLQPSNPYQSNYGFYNIGSGTTINYPTFGIPKQVNGNFYQIKSGGTTLPMWKAPSGYYYPWAPRPSSFKYDYPVPVLIYERSSDAPAPAIPPMSVTFTDMEKFVEEERKDGKLTEMDYNTMLRRIRDLRSKERSIRIAAGGSLESSDESALRRELDKVGDELNWRLNR